MSQCNIHSVVIALTEQHPSSEACLLLWQIPYINGRKMLGHMLVGIIILLPY